MHNVVLSPKFIQSISANAAIETLKVLGYKPARISLCKAKRTYGDSWISQKYASGELVPTKVCGGDKKKQVYFDVQDILGLLAAETTPVMINNW